jgi:N-dimethylarginine dimethylaminohydrolase
MSIGPATESDTSLLFVQPTEFRVEYEINPYMESGVDPAAARRQWERAVERVREHADVTVVDYASEPAPDAAGIESLPDSVFCANHGVAVPGEDRFVLSRMAHPERADEVAHFAAWAARSGYETTRLPEGITFEGAGDALWHPDRTELWVGHGPRTDRAAADELDAMLDATVTPLELVSDRYYHLDVCLTLLGADAAVIVEEAFTPAGLETLEARFDTLIRVPEADTETMGGNCSRVAPGTVAVDAANTGTRELLAEHGYTVVPVETSEFRKSGGSIDCLTLELP